MLEEHLNGKTFLDFERDRILRSAFHQESVVLKPRCTVSIYGDVFEDWALGEGFCF